MRRRLNLSIMSATSCYYMMRNDPILTGTATTSTLLISSFVLTFQLPFLKRQDDSADMFSSLIMCEQTVAKLAYVTITIHSMTHSEHQSPRRGQERCGSD